MDRRNCYTCTVDKCGWFVITVDADEGVTPMFIECRRCGGDARSSFYRVADWMRNATPNAEWRKEMPASYTKFERKISAEYAQKGGLFLHWTNYQDSRMTTSEQPYLTLPKFKKLRLAPTQPSEEEQR